MDQGYEFDFHTDPKGYGEKPDGWGSYLLVYPYGVYDFFSDRLKEICAYLDYRNVDSNPEKLPLPHCRSIQRR